jgi:hypothetical protein
MTYNDILSQEELEALLTPEEVETFKAEQQSRLELELMLSPAHLLLAVRELGDTVARLTARVQQLEYQLEPKPQIFEPEVLQVNNQAIHSAMENIEVFTAVTQIESDIEEVLMPEITAMEMSMLLSNDVILVDSAIDPLTEHGIFNVHTQEKGLISRSIRHRERKPSLLSKLLK